MKVPLLCQCQARQWGGGRASKQTAAQEFESLCFNLFFVSFASSQDVFRARTKVLPATSCTPTVEEKFRFFLKKKSTIKPSGDVLNMSHWHPKDCLLKDHHASLDVRIQGGDLPICEKYVIIRISCASGGGGRGAFTFCLHRVQQQQQQQHIIQHSRCTCLCTILTLSPFRSSTTIPPHPSAPVSPPDGPCQRLALRGALRSVLAGLSGPRTHPSPLPSLLLAEATRPRSSCTPIGPVAD